MTLDDIKKFDPEAMGRRFRCPLCKHRNRTLGVAVTGLYHCFRCHARGRLDGAEYGGELLESEEPARRKDWLKVWNEAQEIPKSAEWRGITKWEGVRYSTQPARYVVFPSRDWTFRVMGCQQRWVTPSTGLKCLTVRGSRLGLFVATASVFTSDPLVIVEGPMCALTFRELGYAAVATFGTNLPSWMSRVTWNRRIMLASDADDAGDEAAGIWRSKLLFRGSVRLRPQVGKDWNEWLQEDRSDLEAFLTRVLGDGTQDIPRIPDGPCWLS